MSTLICSFEGLHDNRVLCYCADFEAHNTVTDGGIKSIYDYVKEFCQEKQ